MYNLIKNCDLNVKKITSSYPHKDNCYEVEITNKQNNASYTNHFFDRNEYHLIEKLKTLKMSDTDLNELVTLIDNYGHGKYDAGSTDESMSNAGAEI